MLIVLNILVIIAVIFGALAIASSGSAGPGSLLGADPNDNDEQAHYKKT